MQVNDEPTRREKGDHRVDGIEPAPAAGVDAGCPAPRILVVEDDDAMRDLIATVLRQDGYDVIESGTLEGVAEIDGDGGLDSIAMIISDLRMPGASGLELLAALRAAHWSTPFILITAFGSDETHAEAGNLGALAVLDKPFAIELLQACVHEALNGTQPGGARSNGTPATPASRRNGTPPAGASAVGARDGRGQPAGPELPGARSAATTTRTLDGRCS